MAKPQSLGQVLRAGRLSRGFSARELAEKLDRSRASIRSWERDETEPPPDDIERLVELLELDPADLNHAGPSLDEDVDGSIDEDSSPSEGRGDGPASEEHASVDGGGADDESDAESEETAAASPLASITTGDASNASGDVEMATGDLDAGAVGDDDDDAGPEAIAEVEPDSGVENMLDPGVVVDAEADTVAHPMVPVPSRRTADPDSAQSSRDGLSGAGTATSAVQAAPEKRRGFFAAIRDPERPWLGYIRAFLTIVVLAVLGWAFVWALRELFAAIGDLRGTDSEGVETLVLLLMPAWFTRMPAR
jgi:transcriptional regulator with XRE-family HTH domain